MGLAPILIIEDDREVRETLVDALEEEGFAVVSAFDGVDALELLKTGFVPRFILLDLTMPRMGGVGFREAIVGTRWAEIPIVVFTADPEARAKAEAMGAAGWLSKPVKLEELFAMAARF
jgi:CheY-like chemotaxis protein